MDARDLLEVVFDWSIAVMRLMVCVDASGPDDFQQDPSADGDALIVKDIWVTSGVDEGRSHGVGCPTVGLSQDQGPGVYDRGNLVVEVDERVNIAAAQSRSLTA